MLPPLCIIKNRVFSLKPCIFKWSSIARAFKAHSEQGVVFNPFSDSQQSIRNRYPAVVAMSMLLWFMLYSAYKILIAVVLSFKIVKAFQSVIHVLFILCYNLLQIFLSLIFALMRVRNTREKDITRGKE